MMGVNRRPEILEKSAPNGQKINRIQPIDKDGLKIMPLVPISLEAASRRS